MFIVEHFQPLSLNVKSEFAASDTLCDNATEIGSREENEFLTSCLQTFSSSPEDTSNPHYNSNPINYAWNHQNNTIKQWNKGTTTTNKYTINWKLKNVLTHLLSSNKSCFWCRLKVLPRCGTCGCALREQDNVLFSMSTGSKLGCAARRRFSLDIHPFYGGISFHKNKTARICRSNLYLLSKWIFYRQSNGISSGRVTLIYETYKFEWIAVSW